MSAPAYTCSPDRLGGEVLLEMLDRGFRHFPVVSATGEVLGVIEDVDLVAVTTRSSFFLGSGSRAPRASTSSSLPRPSCAPSVIAMDDARVAPANIMAVYAVVVDALTRRLLELAVAERGEPAAPFAWLALGSQARREATPSADIDSAIVWFGDDRGGRDPSLAARARQARRRRARALRAAHPTSHGASASNVLFVRSLRSWQHAARSWIDDPTQEQALILVSVLVDSRPVWGVHTGTPVADSFKLASRKPELLRLLARFALSCHPPTGFLRGLVVEHGGEHRGRLDLKHGGLIPIVDLARWAGMAAGVTSASTPERLRAAAAAGTLPAHEAHTLLDAFELISGLRLAHQVAPAPRRRRTRRLRRSGDAEHAHAQPSEGGVPRRRLDPEAGHGRAQRRRPMRPLLRRAGAGEEARAYATARLPRRGTPWLEADWCALDFELTGLDPREDEIVSFGAIPIHEGRLQLRDAVTRLVRPPRESSEAAIRVHGIRTIDLAAPAAARRGDRAAAARDRRARAGGSHGRDRACLPAPRPAGAGPAPARPDRRHRGARPAVAARSRRDPCDGTCR